MRTNHLLLLLLAIAPVGFGCQPAAGPGSGPLSPGQMLPALEAEGWLNGSAPSDLLGQVVVVHCWAYW